MRKLLSLVLAFAMILGLFTFPVSADATTYQTVGQELAGLGVLKGVDAKGTLAEMQNLTREQALVVLTRLMGQEDKALATDAQPGFADVPATHWSAKYVAYAKLQGWTNGTSETQFGLGQNVTTKQVVTLMMRALGYTADWSKEDVMKKAKELGLLEGVSATTDDAIIRGELFIIMKNTLYTKPMGEKIELIYKLGLAENPIPSTLEVVDVKADNLKEVTVEFNQEVDKDTLKDAFKFVGSSHGTLTAKLQEDGKTVVVSLEKVLKNKKTYKLQVSNVKTLSGLMVEKVTKEFKADDNTVPTVESVVVTGPKNIQITFSEPVEKIADSKVKISLASSNSGSNGTPEVVVGNERKVNVTTFALKDGSTYKALVSGFVDYAKYKNIDAEIEFEYAKVSDAPTVEVLSATQEYVEFKFNRPVKNVDLGNFYHTYSSWKPVALYASVEKMDEDVAKSSPGYGNQLGTKPVDKVVARFVRDVAKLKDSDHPLQVGDVEVNVLGKANSKKLVDNWGNQLQDSTLKVSVTADKTAPVVENVEITEENEITVTFSKKVKPDKDNYELLKEDGGKLTETSIKEVKADGNSKIKLVLNNKKQVGKTVILNIKNVKDTTINQNKLVGTESFNLTFGDKTFKGMEEVSFYSHDDVAKLRIQFKEAVDSDTATNKKHYKIRKKGQTDTINVDFDLGLVNDRIVEMSFSKDDWKDSNKLDQNASAPYYNHPAKALEVIMSNEVTDVAGNKISNFQQVKEVKPTAAKPVIKSVIAKSTSEVVITFEGDVEIEDLNAKNFEITNLPAGKKPEVNDATLDGKKVTVTMDTSEGKALLPFSIDGAKIKFTGKPVTTPAGGTLASFEEIIKDEIKPEVAKLKKAANESNIKGSQPYGDGEKLQLLHDNAKTEADFKAAYDKLNLDDKPATALTWDGTDFKLVIEYTEKIKKSSIADGTYKLTSDGGNYVWKFGEVQPIADNYVVIKMVRPNTSDVNEDLYRDVTLTQVNYITDENGNELKHEDAITLQIVNNPTKDQVKAQNDVQINAAKTELKNAVDAANNILPTTDKVVGPGGAGDTTTKVEGDVNAPITWVGGKTHYPAADVATFKTAVQAAWDAHQSANEADQTVAKYNAAKAAVDAAKVIFESKKIEEQTESVVTINVAAGASAGQTTITNYDNTHEYYLMKVEDGKKFSKTASPNFAGAYKVTANITDSDAVKTALGLANTNKVLVVKVKEGKVVAQAQQNVSTVVNGLTD